MMCVCAYYSTLHSLLTTIYLHSLLLLPSLAYSLRRHVEAINKLADAGMFFWDYGNAFLLEASRAGV